jgi:hypothetical protein
VLLFGAHGTQFGPPRMSRAGSLEERMPMNILLLPAKFSRQNPHFTNNLALNQDRFITPYDYHATFEHLIKIPYQPLADQLAKQSFQPSNSYQNSLFYEISRSRSCESANVNDHHCLCHKHLQEISVENSVVVKGANMFVEFMNKIIKNDEEGRKFCEKLSVKEIKRAEILQGNDNLLFRIQVEVSPGKAIFEGTFRWVDTKEIEIVEEYSRISIYEGETCVVKNDVKRFCHCK